MGHEATCEHSPSHAHDNQHIGAVSGFLSGFAAAVQTTVRKTSGSVLLVDSLLCLPESWFGEWRAGCSGDHWEEDNGGLV